jgi:hypothetical protein
MSLLQNILFILGTSTYVICKYAMDTSGWVSQTTPVVTQSSLTFEATLVSNAKTEVCIPTSSQPETQPFLIGANIPWHFYGWDYDTHYEWGNMYNGEFWSTSFHSIKQAGGNVARVWLFCDGRASPRFDTIGDVLPLNDFFYQNLDDMLKRADEHNVQVLLVLWNFDALNDNKQCCGMYAGLHKNVFVAPDKFINDVLIPLVARYKDHAAVYGWELMNEPEFAMESTGKGYTTQLVPMTDMMQFVIRCTEAIHVYAPGKIVTVGAAHPDTMKFWTDENLITYGASNLGLLDVMSVHVYPWSSEIQSLRSWFNSYGKPVLIGETPPKVGPYSTIPQLFELPFTKAAGIMYWAYYSSDTVLGNWTDIYPLIKRFTAVF